MTQRVDVLRLLVRFGIEVLDTHGGEAWARCPAHADTKPSWSINVTTGQHHCFSCGWGGGPAALVLHALGAEPLWWTTRDAWEWIDAHGFTEDAAPDLAVEMYLVGGRMREPFVLPRGVRLEVPPREWPTPARRYMASRSITGWQVRRWRLGYAADGRLAGRIVIPVRDGSGATWGYQARTFVNDRVRYLTPHDDENADTRVMFGEEHWPAGREQVFVTEGAFDALAVERAMHAPIAGLSGAVRALDPLVVGKLATFERVVVVTDADAAGDAAWEALFYALIRHTRVRRVLLPAGADANTTERAVLAEALS
jgi:hypothetical protein